MFGDRIHTIYGTSQIILSAGTYFQPRPQGAPTDKYQGEWEFIVIISYLLWKHNFENISVTQFPHVRNVDDNILIIVTPEKIK